MNLIMEKTDQLHDECIGTPVLTRRGLNNMQAKGRQTERKIKSTSVQPRTSLL